MIKILNIINETVIMNLEIDYYVPITIDFTSNNKLFDDIIYVKLLNKLNEIIELKFNEKNHKLLSITLLVANNIHSINKNTEYLFTEKVKHYGNIICELDDSTKNNHYEYKFDFVIEYKLNKIIIYNPLANKLDKIKMCGVIILIDENQLFSGFIVENLTDYDLKKLNRPSDFNYSN